MDGGEGVDLVRLLLGGEEGAVPRPIPRIGATPPVAPWVSILTGATEAVPPHRGIRNGDPRVPRLGILGEAADPHTLLSEVEASGMRLATVRPLVATVPLLAAPEVVVLEGASLCEVLACPPRRGIPAAVVSVEVAMRPRRPLLSTLNAPRRVPSDEAGGGGVVLLLGGRLGVVGDVVTTASLLGGVAAGVAAVVLAVHRGRMSGRNMGGGEGPSMGLLTASLEKMSGMGLDSLTTASP